MKKINYLRNTIEAYACGCNIPCSGCVTETCSYLSCQCNTDLGNPTQNSALDIESNMPSTYNNIQVGQTGSLEFSRLFSK